MRVARTRLTTAAGFIGGMLLVAVSLRVMARQVHGATAHDVLRGALDISRTRLAAAVLLTAAAFLVLIVYDVLALAYVGRRLPLKHVGFASFVSCGIGHSVGLSLFTSAAIRYRLYAAWGLTTREIARVVAFNSVTFWLGILTTLGVALIWQGQALSLDLHRETNMLVGLGVACVLLVVSYLALCIVRYRGVTIGPKQFSVPSPQLAALQTAVASLDWILAATILLVLMPPHAGLGASVLVAMFLVAQVVALVSHAPGGLGVFDAMMLAMLAPWMPVSSAFSALVAFRVIYYGGPLVVATLLFVGREIALQRHRVQRAARHMARWLPAVAPRALALATFRSRRRSRDEQHDAGEEGRQRQRPRCHRGKPARYVPRCLPTAMTLQRDLPADEEQRRNHQRTAVVDDSECDQGR